LLSVVYPKEGRAPRIDETMFAQPALFAVAIALAELWRSWGIRPDTVVGQSQGEIAAACVAGALSLEDAARVVCGRSRLLAARSGTGVMAAVGLSEADARERIGAYGAAIAIAVDNGPQATVLSGEPAAMANVLAELEADGVFCRRLKVDYASHTTQMDPLC